jgi:putative membrane protein
MNVYLWLKSLHVAAALTWVGGILIAAVVIESTRVTKLQSQLYNELLLRAVRRWDRRVTTPAMLIVWSLGIVMAVQAGWFGHTWLNLKLAIVFALSALHGILSGLLARLAGGNDKNIAPVFRYAAPATIVCVAVIAVLAVAKPF